MSNRSSSEGWYALSEKTSQTDDQRIKDVTPLPPPEHLIKFFPIAGTAVEKLVVSTRHAVRDILHGKDDRLLVVIGPCSIHDPVAAMEYARKLKEQRAKYAETLEVVMRVYFEKPRTTVGWKGLINDPDLDNSFQINKGLRTARELLLDINELGLPAGTEYLDMITPQYIADLISWGAIGARTTESQVHRELSSGLSCPVGFKTGTDGNLRIAFDAIKAASQPHHFLSVTKGGHSAIVSTNGNEDCHVILRGGKQPNYSAADVEAACAVLRASGQREQVMIDFSHANSSKQYQKQLEVAGNVAGQIGRGETRIVGVMVESHLNPGRQDLVRGKPLEYGVSITDACLGWDDTVRLLDTLAAAVRQRRVVPEEPEE